MTNVVRLFLTTLLGLLLVLVIYLTAPRFSYQPKGIILPAKTVMPPSLAENVVLSTVSSPAATQLGFISIEQHYLGQGRDPRQPVRQMEALAKQLAAQVGANMIWVQVLYKPSTVAPLHEWLFQGNALYLANSTIPLEPGIVMPPHQRQGQ